MKRWSSVNTWSRSTREPVEVLGPFVVLDRRDRRLQRRDVGFERDRDLVAEAALHAREDDAEEPRGRGRRREPERGDHDAGPVVVVEAVGEELEPQRDQRVGQRHERRSSRTRGAGPSARRGSRASPCATASCSAGGRSSGASGECVMHDLLAELVELHVVGEPRRLEVEHRVVAAALRPSARRGCRARRRGRGRPRRCGRPGARSRSGATRGSWWCGGSRRARG